MADSGDLATPIWVTEMGWAQRSKYEPLVEREEQGQAQMLTAAWNLLLANRGT